MLVIIEGGKYESLPIGAEVKIGDAYFVNEINWDFSIINQDGRLLGMKAAGHLVNKHNKFFRKVETKDYE